MAAISDKGRETSQLSLPDGVFVRTGCLAIRGPPVAESVHMTAIYIYVVIVFVRAPSARLLCLVISPVIRSVFTQDVAVMAIGLHAPNM